ncbi:MAG: Rap1a/Tai family immunity protein [Pseudomonadales bacterium]
MKKPHFWLIALLFLSSSVFSAEPRPNGYDLLDACKKASDYYQTKELIGEIGAGYCVGVLSTASAFLTTFKDDLPKSMEVCFPEQGVANRELVRIVKDYLSDNSSMLQLNDIFLVMSALQNAYPCGPD